MQVSEKAKHASEDATYRFDAMGNMTTKTSSSRNAGSDLNYSFDYEYYAGTHRVARIGDWRYEYDGNGNLVAEVYGATTGGVGTAGRSVREDGGVWSADYGFGYIDATGMSGNGGATGERREYGWNERNLLRSSANRQFSAEYRYGADGERAVKFSVSGTARSETLYFSRLLTVSRIQGYETESKHVYVGEARIATKRKDVGNVFAGQEARQVYYYHPDHLGSTQLVTDWDGRIYEHLEYTPYGELWVDYAVAAVGMNPTVYRFSGKEMDEETGFYYYGARYLDPRTSRWISADPAMGEYIPSAPVNDEARKRNGNLPGMGGVFNHVNLHVYHYAGNNPVKYVDPDGKASSYKVGDEYYIFRADVSPLDRIVGLSYGFLPYIGFLGGPIVEGIHNLNGFQTIDTRDTITKYGDVASSIFGALDTAIDLLGNVGTALPVIGTIANVLSNLWTVASIVDEIATGPNRVAKETLISRYLGGSLQAKSHDGVAYLYAYAAVRMDELINSGDVSFTADSSGHITFSYVNPDAMNDLRDELTVLRSHIGEDPIKW